MRFLRVVLLVASANACADVFGFDDLHLADSGPASDGAGTESGITDAAAEAALMCEGGPIQACGGQCVDIRTSGSNCGACNHDCGGGSCTMGVCQPAVIVDSLMNPVFDVDTTNVYYSSGSKVLTCPLGGCTVAPVQLEDTMTTVYGSDTPGTGMLLVNQGNFFYVADPVQNTVRPTLYTCPIAGCPSMPTLLRNCGLTGGFNGGTKGPSNVDWVCYRDLQYTTCTGDGGCVPAPGANLFLFASGFVQVLPMASDANGIYFIDPQSTALEHCPNAVASDAGATCTPDVLVSTTSGITQLAVFNSVLYMLFPGMSGGIPGGIIYTCPTTGTCTPTPYISKLPNPTLIAADATGVYWFDHDSPLNSSVTGQIMTCPLTGCVGGPRSLAQMQTGSTKLVTDPSFVYWATGTQILRVAK